MTNLDVHEQLADRLLGCVYGKLTPIQRSVIDLIATESPSGVNPALKLDDRTYWQRLADRVAEIGGSWAFIFGFAAVLFGWCGVNLALMLIGRAFDPYPFIFLNLMLSTLAAIQAPIILMSQNRQASRDRQSAEHDYVVNLRAELEIMHLHDKLDALRQDELVAILRAQAECIALLTRQVEEGREA